MGALRANGHDDRLVERRASPRFFKGVQHPASRLPCGYAPAGVEDGASGSLPVDSSIILAQTPESRPAQVVVSRVLCAQPEREPWRSGKSGETLVPDGIDGTTGVQYTTVTAVHGQEMRWLVLQISRWHSREA
jgi:hypothetical protein